MLAEKAVPSLGDPKIQRDLDKLCRTHHVRKILVFGSTIHGTSAPDSDLDLIVEFLAGMTPGFSFARLGEELSSLLGRRVDLHTVASLSRYFRDEVIREAQVIYAGQSE